MNITKRESAYRIRVFCGKDEKGISKFVYQTVRFDDPRFEGMTEKKRDKAVEATGFEFEQQVNSLAVLPKLLSEPLRSDGLLIMRIFSRQQLPVNDARISRRGLTKLSVICEWIKSRPFTFKTSSIPLPSPE